MSDVEPLPKDVL
jgi:anti-anti-sigma factor